MTLSMLAFLAAAEGGEGGMGPFKVEGGLIFWTWLVFLALFLVLRKFAWPMILKATEERERKIQAQLAEAEKLNAEAKGLLEQQTKLLAEARGMAQTMLAGAKATAEKERAAGLEKGKQAQEALLERARRDIAGERDKAIAELRREAVELALGAASKVIGQRLDTEADRRIVLDYLAKLETIH